MRCVSCAHQSAVLPADAFNLSHSGRNTPDAALGGEGGRSNHPDGIPEWAPEMGIDVADDPEMAIEAPSSNVSNVNGGCSDVARMGRGHEPEEGQSRVNRIKKSRLSRKPSGIGKVKDRRA